jgi:CheY-like chemotaxis protein
MRNLDAMRLEDSVTIPTFDIEFLLEWACLAAAQARHNSVCMEQHRRALLARGEATNRLDEITQWRESARFSDKEKSVLGLSEAISLHETMEEIETPLHAARAHLNPDELVRLSARVAAVNEWIELREDIPIRVLVVEDNPNDQELLNRQLQTTPFANHVLFLSDPRIALEMVCGSSSETLRDSLVVIFLDVHLPHMSGIDFLRKIRETNLWKNFPVVIMTTDPNPDTVAACKDLRVKGFVEKPVTMSRFTEVIAPLFHQPA